LQTRDISVDEEKLTGKLISFGWVNPARRLESCRDFR